MLRIVSHIPQVILFVIMFIFPVASNAQPGETDNGQPDNLYQAGLQAYENGDTDQALKLWFDGYLAARKAGSPDPRLGVAFLQATAADSVAKHYDTASLIYNWGMSIKAVEPYKELMRDEVARLEILLPAGQYNKLRHMLDGNNPAVAATIRAVWDRGDPSPSTQTNERLIEHWQRIAHARKAYPGYDPYYNTNDQGLTYIRYGPPNRVQEGTFSPNSSVVRNTAFRAIEVRHPEASAFGNTSEAEIFVAQESFFESASPKYEIWIYNHQLTQKSDAAASDNLIVIFGKEDGIGTFKRLNSPGELVSESNYSQRNSYDFSAQLKFNIGLMIQAEMFRQFAPFDDYFAEGLDDIEGALFSKQAISRFAGQNFKDQFEFNLSRLETIAGPQESSLPAIDLQVSTYRFLDEQDQPYHIAVLYSFPHKYLAVNQIGYNYRHVFLLRGPQAAIARETELPPIVFETIEGNTPLPAQSQFRIPHPADSLTEEFAAEYYVPRGDTTASELKLVAAGKRTPAPPEELLSADTRQLEASDLVAGYTTETEPHGYFPFRVAYRNKIPAGRDLMFHFEIYHLRPGPEGIAEFQVVYELKKDDNLVQKLFATGDQQGRLTLNFETSATRLAENIEVETSKLEPGTYDLNIRIQEPTTDRSIERKLEFEVME